MSKALNPLAERVGPGHALDCALLHLLYLGSYVISKEKDELSSDNSLYHISALKATGYEVHCIGSDAILYCMLKRPTND